MYYAGAQSREEGGVLPSPCHRHSVQLPKRIQQPLKPFFTKEARGENLHIDFHPIFWVFKRAESKRKDTCCITWQKKSFYPSFRGANAVWVQDLKMYL